MARIRAGYRGGGRSHSQEYRAAARQVIERPRGHACDRPPECPAARTRRSLMGGPALGFAGRRATELSETMFVERWFADALIGRRLRRRVRRQTVRWSIPLHTLDGHPAPLASASEVVLDEPRAHIRRWPG
jgi:hypothetical protein